MIVCRMDTDSKTGRNRMKGSKIVQGRLESLKVNNTSFSTGDIPKSLPSLE